LLKKKRVVTTADMLETIALAALFTTYVAMKVWAERAIRRQTVAHMSPDKYSQHRRCPL
jgi:hypothetical protein